MLSYDLECRDCQHPFELTVESKEAFVEAAPRCPKCGSSHYRKSLTVPYRASFTAAKGRNDAKYPYVSHSLPRGMKGVDRYAAGGKPIIESKWHERDIMAGAGTGERFTRE